MSEGDDRPIVILSANSCWNLLNFRDALIAGLQEAGYRVVAFVPVDGHAEKLRSRGVEVYDFPMARSGINPAVHGRLLLRYLSAFVDEEVTGALCRRRDAASLADAMERIAWSSAERLEALGRAARKKVEREFR